MDQELVARAKDGDQRAFVALTAADYSRLFRLAFGILRDHHAVKSVAAAVIVALFGGFLLSGILPTSHDGVLRRR